MCPSLCDSNYYSTGYRFKINYRPRTSIYAIPLSRNVQNIRDTQDTHHKLSPRVERHDYPLTPNDPSSGRTAPLTSKRCILYIYSTNTGTEYFKHGIYSPFFSLQNTVCLIILTYLVPVLFTFYTQNVLKVEKNNSGGKRLRGCTAISTQAYHIT